MPLKTIIRYLCDKLQASWQKSEKLVNTEVMEFGL